MVLPLALLLVLQMDDLTGAVMVSMKDISMEMMIMLVEELLYKFQNHAIFVLFC